MPADADTDFFGWGEATPPFLCSNVNDDYQPGITAENVELSDAANNWAAKFNNSTPTPLYIEQGVPFQGEHYIVLSSAEWQNLFANQYWGYATADDVKGIVVFPSTQTVAPAGQWTKGTSYNLTPVNASNRYADNAISQTDIDSKGLLFLPAAGYRGGTTLWAVGSYGRYWSSTSSSATNAYFVDFNATYFLSASNYSRYYGYSVRLASVATTPAE